MKDNITFSWYLCSEASFMAIHLLFSANLSEENNRSPMFFFSLVFCYLGFRLITIERS